MIHFITRKHRWWVEKKPGYQKYSKQLMNTIRTNRFYIVWSSRLIISGFFKQYLVNVKSRSVKISNVKGLQELVANIVCKFRTIYNRGIVVLVQHMIYIFLPTIRWHLFVIIKLSYNSKNIYCKSIDKTV